MSIFDTIVSNQADAVAVARASYITLLQAGLENADPTTLAGLLDTLGFSLDQAKTHEKVYADIATYTAQAANLASTNATLQSTLATSNAAFVSANNAINVASANLKAAQAAFDTCTRAASALATINQKWAGIIV